MWGEQIFQTTICNKEASREACALPKKCKCQRATRSKIRPILTRKANGLHDLQRAQKYDRFLRDEAVQGWSDLFNVRLQIFRTIGPRISMYDGTKLN